MAAETATVTVPSYTEVLDVPQKSLGRVIGRGGETIKGLQSQSGASITINKDSTEGDFRKITIAGEQAAVAIAKQL